MNYYYLASIILILASTVFSLYKQFQMFQQNSYFPSRYSKWLFDNIDGMDTLIFLGYSVLVNAEYYLIAVIVSAIYLILKISSAIKTHKTSIKKLVFTARVKRLYVGAIIIPIALFVLYIIYNKILLGGIFAMLMLILCFLYPFLVYVSWILTLPLEKAFGKYYINDAKKILKSYNNLKVIGVTGSYGKTSMKFILTRILNEAYNTVCTPHSFNTTFGVVRTIRENLKRGTEYFVCEMGAKNKGDIKEICDIVSPDIALITSVGAQHLETFKTTDNVFKTKFELSDSVKKKGGKVFVNIDSEEIKNRINKEDFITYGTNPDADFYAYDIYYSKEGSLFKIKLGGKEVQFTSQLLGLHSIINITGAVAVAYTLGIDIKDIQYTVASLTPTEHRLELKSGINRSVLIDDAYNANPEGSLEAVRVLGSFDGMKKVLITPGLIELGSMEYECNYNLGLEATKFCDIIILVGKNRSKPLMDAIEKTDFNKENVFIANSFMEAMEIYSRFADSDSVLLIENDLPDNYLN